MFSAATSLSVTFYKLVSSSSYCYDPGSSLRKRNDLQGKDGSTSVLRNLTNGLAWADLEGDISRTRMDGFKGESLMAMAEVGAEDTGSDSYQ